MAHLPDAPNVIFMAARKFGSTGDERLTWAMNAYLPALVAERFRASRIVAFSTGNVYPLMPVAQGGATEIDAARAGRRIRAVGARRASGCSTYFSRTHGTPMTILRLNYAIELRYGVLLDIGTKVFERQPVDLAMGCANVIWQGDANSICLRSFAPAPSPPVVLNLTGPETLVGPLGGDALRRALRRRAGVRRRGIATTALLNNAARSFRLFGYPTVTVEQMIEWTAHLDRRGRAHARQADALRNPRREILMTLAGTAGARRGDSRASAGADGGAQAR